MKQEIEIKKRPENEPLNPQWRKPNFDEDEIGEIELTSRELGIDSSLLVTAFNEAVLQELNDEDWESMLNCDSKDKMWDLGKVRRHLKDERDFDRIEEGIKAGNTFPAPAVLYRKNQPPYLIGGNSRLLACRVFGLRPMILALHLENK